MVKRLDPVSARLVSAEADPESVLTWLEGQQGRTRMHRQANWCSFTGWLLVSFAAIVSCSVAFYLAGEVAKIFDDEFMGSSDRIPTISLQVVPAVLGTLAVLIVVGGFVAWAFQVMPGWRSTALAIDWSTASDAVSRLLQVGCTYPEALRTAATSARTRSNRRWLRSAADQIERGGTSLFPAHSSDRDAAVLQLLIESNESEPVAQWAIAASHFREVAQRRLGLLLGATPALATILAGLLIWFSISSTLAWMWSAVSELIGGLT